MSRRPARKSLLSKIKIDNTNTNTKGKKLKTNVQRNEIAESSTRSVLVVYPSFKQVEHRNSSFFECPKHSMYIDEWITSELGKSTKR